MPVRRAWPVSWAARGVAPVAVLVLLSITGCETETARTTSATPSTSPSVAPGAPSASPSPSQSSSSTVPPGQGHVVPPSRAGTDKDKKVQGGGFTTAVPGSDAPDRKVDVGPQYQVSEDVDIREIERLVKAVERIAKRQRVEDPLTTGDSVAEAVGTFSYRWFADGSVQPDPRWVAANIRTGTVPILGEVTCHRVMFPQLRGALREVVARGLADKIHPEEYAGCYVPRFIGRDPSNGLSLHTWGIAVDLNVPGNLRGTVGEIDRTVVAIFKKWGFAWGGDWSWTDPMHFELARIVKAR